MKTNTIPVCLTVAGSDSGGCAGIQVDLKTFEYFNVFGTSVITTVTAQNPKEVQSIHPVPDAEVTSQLKAVFDMFDIRAIKTGMLYSENIICRLLEFLEHINYDDFLIIDPIMVAGCGDPLSKVSRYGFITGKLLRASDLVTPNLAEAEVLLGRTLKSYSDIIIAVRELSEMFKTNVLLKGGHFKHEMASDWYCDGDEIYEVSCPYLKVKTTHGTGCRLSSAIAANVAIGKSIFESVRIGKIYVYRNLKHILQVGNQCFALGQPVDMNAPELNITKLKN